MINNNRRVKRTGSKLKLDKELERLIEPFVAPRQTGEKPVIFMGLDNGSTRERGVIISKDIMSTSDPEMVSKYTHHLPSLFRHDEVFNISDNTDIIDPQGEEAYHNLDTNISCVTTDPALVGKSLITNHRVLRGTKAESMTGSSYKQEMMIVNEDKNTSLAYHINAIDGTGYTILQAYTERGLAVPKEVDLYLGLSLRSEEKTNANVQQLKDLLVGQTFEWTLRDPHVKISINVKDVVVSTELEKFAELLIESFLDSEDRDLREGEEFSILGSGGSNSAFEVIKNGESDRNRALQLKECGQTFRNIVQKRIDALRTSKGLKTVELSEAQIDSLLEHGVVYIGKERFDYLQTIIKLKEAYGQEIARSLQKAAEAARINLNDQTAIYFVGGLFEPTIPVDENDQPIDINSEKYPLARTRAGVREIIPNRISDYIGKALEKALPSPRFLTVEGNLVPLGNLNAVIDENFEVYEKVEEEYFTSLDKGDIVLLDFEQAEDEVAATVEGDSNLN